MDLNDSQELQFYYLNYFTLFENQKSESELSELSKSALNLKEQSKAQYNQRLEDLVGQNSSSKNIKDLTFPYLRGWNLKPLLELKKKYGGVILSLFHYGDHRHILTDLACQKFSCVAPIAGRSYWNYYENSSSETHNLRNYLQLVEVEGENVSMELLKAIKRKGVVGIYADGNMGPENIYKKSGTVQIEFMSRLINVKAGIGRLALMFKYPVIPIFANKPEEGKPAGHVQIGNPIVPIKEGNKENAVKEILIKLYNQLEEKVNNAPENWEYALCFHRWADQSNYHDKDNNKNSDSFIFDENSKLTLNSKRTSLIKQREETCLIDIKEGVGYKPPKICLELFLQLSLKQGVTFEWLQQNHSSEESIKAILAILEQLFSKEIIKFSIIKNS